MNERIQKACTYASRLAERGGVRAGEGEVRPRRWFVTGDPQTTCAHFLEILDIHGLLGADGRLHPDVGLVSVGDHFDYRLDGGSGALSAAEVDGRRILAWLASHPTRQVALLLGNHDAARVIEFAALDDLTFARARESASRMPPTTDVPGRSRALETFHAEFPGIPTPDLAARDFASFSEAQRTLVRDLLVARRFRLGLTAGRDGIDVLVTHAGVTTRELGMLEIGGERSPRRIAQALDGLLEAAVTRVEPAWAEGRDVPLDLEPLHVAGRTGEEGGGLLYHRPADPERGGDSPPDIDWEFRRDRPRRFHPCTLPIGLWQVFGHTPPKRCAKEMPDWLVRDSAPGDGLRTLTVRGEDVRYARWLEPPDLQAAGAWLVDAGFHDEASGPAACPLLEVEGVVEI